MLPSQMVFCSGPPRSGTTMLNRLLCDSDRAGPFLPECSYLTRLVKQYDEILRFSDKERFDRYFRSRSNCTAFFSQCVRLFVTQLMAAAGLDPARALVLKDPELSLHADALLELLPACKLLLIVRDPRDIVASLKVVRQKQKAPWTAEAALADLAPFFAAVLGSAGVASDRSMVVRYEDVANGRGDILDPLSRFVGYPITGHIDVGQSKNTRAFDRSDPFYSPNYEGDITSDRVGTWRTVLTPAEVQAVEASAKTLMGRFGYEAVRTASPIPQGARRWY